jgi:hypothetical protein
LAHLVKFILAFAVALLSATTCLAKPVRSEAEAIVIAKRVCGKNPLDYDEAGWRAQYRAGNSEFFSSRSRGWDVVGRFYPKRLPPGETSIVDAHVFVPMNGSSPACTQVSN